MFTIMSSNVLAFIGSCLSHIVSVIVTQSNFIPFPTLTLMSTGSFPNAVIHLPPVRKAFETPVTFFAISYVKFRWKSTYVTNDINTTTYIIATNRTVVSCLSTVSYCSSFTAVRKYLLAFEAVIFHMVRAKGLEPLSSWLQTR